MTDSIRYSSADSSSVIVEPQGWNCPQPCNTYHQSTITQWLEGRTDEWDAQKLAYDSYIDITTYEQRLADYDAGVVACEATYQACIVDELQTGCEQARQDCNALLVYPTKPYGYYTQEEVDASQAKWDAWNLLPVDERGQEPVILQRPVDLPVVAEPAVLVPNTILAYDKNYGLTLEQVQNNKTQEIEAYADSLIQTANTTPQVGITVNVNLNKKRIDARRKNLADKAAGELVLSQAEKDQAKVDQKLAEFESKIYADADKATTNMKKLNTIAEIEAFDILSQSWNIWTPPV